MYIICTLKFRVNRKLDHYTVHGNYDEAMNFDRPLVLSHQFIGVRMGVAKGCLATSSHNLEPPVCLELKIVLQDDDCLCVF